MQLILIAILVAGAILLYRRFVADATKLAERSRREERERQSGATGTLVKDPETGEYRLDRSGEV
ncbi:hypothetical protein [Gellertiella hungarica]|uniref:Membrane protein implicated in regulation of membrane protease activity n=1 Tax=Gellertiella hungarica TaxID=1572859 RepID=A0A7W6NKF9_9HYPH|nr:hypothetical protein [Gellertiella hungarica]MBB4064360.1 membrane protein implicated in regulation of membrane protease activity [Gellertiella hungarica]